MSSTQPGEFPNQDLGIEFVTDANHGALNSLASPLRIGTCTLWAGAGVPGIGGNIGDLYINTSAANDQTFFYRCTTAGTAGNAVWAAITGA